MSRISELKETLGETIVEVGGNQLKAEDALDALRLLTDKLVELGEDASLYPQMAAVVESITTKLQGSVKDVLASIVADIREYERGL